MFKSLVLTLLTGSLFLALTGCTALDELTSKVDTVKKEGTEAAENLKNEALEVKTKVETKVNQVETAVNSVTTAVDTVNQAVDDVKTVTK
jgi:uncharacterized protein YoxC